jgi:hypothetical protein
MAFNSNTYYANKYARLAKENLATAREIKARVVAGTAYEWEAARIGTFARLALGDSRLSRSYRILSNLRKGR